MPFAAGYAAAPLRCRAPLLPLLLPLFRGHMLMPLRQRDVFAALRFSPRHAISFTIFAMLIYYFDTTMFVYMLECCSLPRFCLMLISRTA